MEPFVRLPLTNAYNVRDLGGYACRDGGRTRWNRLLRGDDLSSLDNAEIEFLLGYGLGTVIDLRSQAECERRPSLFAARTEVDYFCLPLGLDGVDDVSRLVTDDPKIALARFYQGIIERCGDALKTILESIAQAKDGAVLFHCAIGKDRTGIIAALLLAAVGVGNADIIANYMVSFQYLRENPFVREALNVYAPELFYSSADTMRTLMDFIDSSYGGIEAYLKTINVSEDTLSAIRNRFCVA